MTLFKKSCFNINNKSNKNPCSFVALWQLTANHQNTFVRIAHFAYCDFDLILSEHFLFVGQMRTQNNLHNFRFSYLGESSFLWII